MTGEEIFRRDGTETVTFDASVGFSLRFCPKFPVSDFLEMYEFLYLA